MQLLHDLAQMANLIMPIIIIPLVRLNQSLTEIKIDIAKLKQQTGVN